MQNPITTGGTATTNAYSYPTAGSAHPHAVQSVTHTGGATGTDSYSYDAAGNTKTRPGQTLTYDRVASGYRYQQLVRQSRDHGHQRGPHSSGVSHIGTYIGAYWGSRRESVHSCAERLAHFFDLLALVDPSISSWFSRGASKGSAEAPVGRDSESLREVLLKGRNRQDLGSVIEELGYNVGLWNRSRPEVGFSATVGAYPTFAGALNNVVLQMPSIEDGAVFYRPGAAVALLGAVTEAWEPEWATWTTHGWRDAQLAGSREPVIGWLTYLRGEQQPILPGDSTEILNGGLLVRAAADYSSVGEYEILSTRNALRSASVLRPIP